MKKQNFLVGGIIGVCVLIGCGVISRFSTQIVYAQSKEANEEEETVMMNEQEKNFLKKIYVDEGRIDRNDLLGYQVITLDQYRFAQSYLKEKYPSYRFDIINCEPMNIMDDFSLFYFCEIGNPADVYSLHVSGVNKCNMTGIDNFYTVLLNEPLAAYIKKELVGICDNLISVQTNLTGLQGVEFDETMTIEAALKYGNELAQNTNVFILTKGESEEKRKEIVEDLEAKIKQLNIYGAYMVYFCTDDSTIDRGMENGVLRKTEYIEKYSFQNFY